VENLDGNKRASGWWQQKFYLKIFACFHRRRGKSDEFKKINSNARPTKAAGCAKSHASPGCTSAHRSF